MMESDVGKLFIGGISWETTEDKLISYFRAFGEVIEAVIMKDRATGRARGFGFVVFADPSVADRVVREKHMIDGRMVEAKKAVPRGEQHNALRINIGGLLPPSLTRTKKIFVGGLAASVTETEFRSYFEHFGEITDAVVMYDHGTQRPRGFGFITYASEESVDKVLESTFHELNGKMVEVKRAIPKELSTGPSRINGAGLSPGMIKGSPYGGDCQIFNVRTPSYGAHMDGRYGLSPRGAFPPFGGAGYANLNLGYGTASYVENGPLGGNGLNASPTTGNIYGGSRSGYGSNNALSGYGSTTLGRNLWSIRTDEYLGGRGSLLNAGNWALDLGGYERLGTWGSPQNPNSSSSGYGANSRGYVGIGSGHGPSNQCHIGGHDSSSNSAYGKSVGGYGMVGSFLSSAGDNLYNNPGFVDPVLRSPGYDPFNSINISSDGLGYELNGDGGGFAVRDYDSGYTPARQARRVPFTSVDSIVQYDEG